MPAERRGRNAPGNLGRLAEAWPAEPSELLDAAARLAGRHGALANDHARVRSLIELLVNQHELARQLSGGPRNVPGDHERTLLLQARAERGPGEHYGRRMRATNRCFRRG